MNKLKAALVIGCVLSYACAGTCGFLVWKLKTSVNEIFTQTSETKLTLHLTNIGVKELNTELTAIKGILVNQELAIEALHDGVKAEIRYFINEENRKDAD